jgi:hypothetical protein
MRKFMLWTAVAALTIFVSQSAIARTCPFKKGEDRWKIKTTVSDDALDRAVRALSLESLMDTLNPPLTKNQRSALAGKLWAGKIIVEGKNGEDVSLTEGSMVSVEGFLYRARCQPDGDYHLEIGIVNKKGVPHCLVVEVPDPGQIKKNSELKSRVTNVRETLDGLPAGIFTGKSDPVSVKITGQLFLDAHHIQKNDPGGGRGTKHCATNVWEIHPITGLDVTSE